MSTAATTGADPDELQSIARAVQDVITLLRRGSVELPDGPANTLVWKAMGELAPIRDRLVDLT